MSSTKILTIGRLTFDAARGRLGAPDGEQVQLTPRETEVLLYLHRHRGPVSERELLTEVFGYAPAVRSRAAHATLTRMRRKLATWPLELVRVRGRGVELRLADDDTGPARSLAQAWLGDDPLLVDFVRQWLREEGHELVCRGIEDPNHSRIRSLATGLRPRWERAPDATRHALASLALFHGAVPRAAVESCLAYIAPQVDMNALRADGWLVLRGERALLSNAVRSLAWPPAREAIEPWGRWVTAFVHPSLYRLGGDTNAVRLAVPALAAGLGRALVADAASPELLEVALAIVGPSHIPRTALRLAPSGSPSDVLLRFHRGEPVEVAGEPASDQWFVSRFLVAFQFVDDEEPDEAIRLLDDVLQAAVLARWPFFERLAHSHLARICRDEGRLAAALTHHEHALAIARAARDTYVERQEELNRAATLFELGQTELAMATVADNLDRDAPWVTSGTAAFAHTAIQARVSTKIDAWIRSQLPLLAAAAPAIRAELARGLAREVRALVALGERRPRSAARLWCAAADALEPHLPARAAVWRRLVDELRGAEPDPALLLEHPLLAGWVSQRENSKT